MKWKPSIYCLFNICKFHLIHFDSANESERASERALCAKTQSKMLNIIQMKENIILWFSNFAALLFKYTEINEPFHWFCQRRRRHRHHHSIVFSKHFHLAFISSAFQWGFCSFSPPSSTFDLKINLILLEYVCITSGSILD